MAAQEESVEVIPDGQPLARANEVLPKVIHILPVAARPFFPGQGVPLVMDAEHWRTTLEAIHKSGTQVVGLILTRGEAAEEARPQDFYGVGTVCRIHRVQQVDDKLQVLVECLQRFTLERMVSYSAPFSARVDYQKEFTGKPDDQIKAYALAIVNTIRELLPLNPLYQEELKVFLERFGPEDPPHLADFAASLTTSDKEDLQAVLEAFELLPRMERVLTLLSKELELAKAQQKIRASVEERMEKQQRQFFLREQLKAIQKELGIAKDDKQAELDTFRERLQDLKLSEEADQRITEEMNKLALLEPGSPEHAVTRNYLDWMTVLPWGRHSKDNLDIDRARKILDRDHYGLDDVKPHPRVSGGRYHEKRGQAVRSFCWSGHPASARPPSADRSPMRCRASSIASRSAACATRPRSRATAAPTSAPCRASSSRR